MSFPVNIANVPLSNSIYATIEVTMVNNIQNAEVAFNTPVGKIGSITLTPMQPTASNKEFYAGSQKLFIEKIEFRPAFGPSKGKITCKGYATNQDGNDPAEFNFQIAEWEE